MTDEEIKEVIEREGLPYAWTWRNIDEDGRENILVGVDSANTTQMMRAYKSIKRQLLKGARLCIEDTWPAFAKE